MVRRFFRFTAWAVLCVVTVKSFGPASSTPPSHPHLLQLASFFALGSCFGVAYPRHWRMIGALLTGYAAASEIAQTFLPAHEGRLLEGALKICGLMLGLSLALLVEGRALRTSAITPPRSPGP